MSQPDELGHELIVFRRAILTPVAGWSALSNLSPPVSWRCLPVPGSGTGGGGMLVVETIARIRREFFVKGRSIKEIVRDLKVCRNTVRKVLRSGETSFSYEREVQPLPRLGRWPALLDRLLSGQRGERGYIAAIKSRPDPAVRAARAAAAAAAEPARRRSGRRRAAAAAAAASGGRRAALAKRLVRAYPRETQEMVFDAHDRAFAFFRGACRRGPLRQHEDGGRERSSSARAGSITAASCRCAPTIWSSRPPARL